MPLIETLVTLKVQADPLTRTLAGSSQAKHLKRTVQFGLVTLAT